MPAVRWQHQPEQSGRGGIVGAAGAAHRGQQRRLGAAASWAYAPLITLLTASRRPLRGWCMQKGANNITKRLFPVKNAPGHQGHGHVSLPSRAASRVSTSFLGEKSSRLGNNKAGGHIRRQYRPTCPQGQPEASRARVHSGDLAGRVRSLVHASTSLLAPREILTSASVLLSHLPTRDPACE